jgi:ABC-type dipeptide/oligopeptide/nickel transport system ATPase subunit
MQPTNEIQSQAAHSSILHITSITTLASITHNYYSYHNLLHTNNKSIIQHDLEPSHWHLNTSATIMCHTATTTSWLNEKQEGKQQSTREQRQDSILSTKCKITQAYLNDFPHQMEGGEQQGHWSKSNFSNQQKMPGNACMSHTQHIQKVVWHYGFSK